MDAHKLSSVLDRIVTTANWVAEDQVTKIPAEVVQQLFFDCYLVFIPSLVIEQAMR